MTGASAGLLAFVALAFFLGGALKGIVGMGLPLVGVSLLSLVVDPRLALALMIVPIVVSNGWQALSIAEPMRNARRFAPLILLFALGTWWGARLLVSIDTDTLLWLLGIIVVLACSASLANPSVQLPERHERWAGSLVGLGAGLLNGISTVNGPPLALYLVSLRLDKDTFVAAYGLIAVCGAIPLAGAYIGLGLAGPSELLWSTLALLPVMAGWDLRHPPL